MAPKRGVALLPAEPAGALPLRAAGRCGFVAELSWRTGGAPPEPLLPAPPVLEDGARLRLAEEEAGCGLRLLRGEVLALERGALGAALEAVLRAVMEAAALSGALLEAEVVREEPPREADMRVLGRLRRDLLGAGFAAREMPHSWSPAPGGAAWVGTGGREDVEAFLREHPLWEVL